MKKKNGSQFSKILINKNIKKEIQNNYKFKFNENDLITNIDFNILDYFCGCSKMRNKVEKIELFNYGVNFYKNEMNIINIFNLNFLIKIMIMHYSTNKNNILNQIIEIPIKI